MDDAVRHKMTLAELLPTPAHAKVLARHLVVNVSIFDAERETHGGLPIVELVTAVLWHLAQQGGALADLPRMLAGGRRALAGTGCLDEAMRAGLQVPEAGRQIRAWADVSMFSSSTDWYQRWSSGTPHRAPSA